MKCKLMHGNELVWAVVSLIHTKDQPFFLKKKKKLENCKLRFMFLRHNCF